MHALILSLCSYMLKFSNGEGAIIFFGVRITIIGLCRRGGLVPRPKPAQNTNWPFNHFQSRHQCVLGAGHEIPHVAKR